MIKVTSGQVWKRGASGLLDECSVEVTEVSEDCVTYRVIGASIEGVVDLELFVDRYEFVNEQWSKTK